MNKIITTSNFIDFIGSLNVNEIAIKIEEIENNYIFTLINNKNDVIEKYSCSIQNTSANEIFNFIKSNNNWVITNCNPSCLTKYKKVISLTVYNCLNYLLTNDQVSDFQDFYNTITLAFFT